MKTIATIHNDFDTKFGIPRQSGLAEKIVSKIIFEPEFRCPEALRGIEDFSHLWLIWEFSENKREGFTPTVRPPRLGGNKRMGVFATRSPFRPNPIGLSCVKLLSVRQDTKYGAYLEVSGADLMNGTPIFDIKPYLPLSDRIDNASSGFAAEHEDYSLEVADPNGLLETLDENTRANLTAVLEGDPRPAYQNDPNRIYGFSFAGKEIKFKADGRTVTLVDIEKK